MKPEPAVGPRPQVHNAIDTETDEPLVVSWTASHDGPGKHHQSHHERIRLPENRRETP
jgi:hypothetical protein